MSSQQAENLTYQIKINLFKCIGCGDCMTVCPVNQDIKREKGFLDESNALILVKNSNVRVINEELCTGCGSCIPACPVKAIDIIMKA
ncbi:MAG: indolepyruvate ferredoxin oxidoreductase subunit alpha [Promethearchaeota archaeon]